MMKKITITHVLATLIAAFALVFAGCEENGNGFDDAMDDTGDAMEDAADDTGDAVEDTGDDIEDATN